MRRAVYILLVSAAAAVAVDTTPAIEPLFGNDVHLRNRLRELIGEADYDVVCVMDRFTDYDMAEALELAARRGRRVRVVLGGDKLKAAVGRAMRDHLAANGVEVRAGDETLLSRFVVLDGVVVIVGSYPYITEAGTSSLTDAVVIRDETIAKEYLAFFDYVYKNAK